MTSEEAEGGKLLRDLADKMLIDTLRRMDRLREAASYPRVELREHCHHKWWAKWRVWHVIDIARDGNGNPALWMINPYAVSCHLTYRGADRAARRLEQK